MKKTVILSLLFTCALTMSAQEEKHVRQGWTFGLLPSVAYDADLGLQYGALTNIYYFGDGSTYPEYLHSFYAEAAYTTKHFGIFRTAYDSKHLIPGHRLSIDLTYLPDQMCDFYGFNGYQSNYNAAYSNQNDPAYISRAYYKYRRDLFRFSADLQGSLTPSLSSPPQERESPKGRGGIGMQAWACSISVSAPSTSTASTPTPRRKRTNCPTRCRFLNTMSRTDISVPPRQAAVSTPTCTAASPTTRATACKTPPAASTPTPFSPTMPGWAI